MNTFKQGACCALIAAVLAGTAVAAPCSGPRVTATAIQAGEPLSLDAVLAEVRNASPEVRKAALETRAREADADQAGRWLNPSIGLELENFSGSGPLAGFDQTETTFSIAQTFQLGGKRTKRQRAARASAALATAECSAILRETELEAVTLFYELDAAVKLVRLANQSAELADTLSETVGKRVDAGAAAPPELSRAKADAAALRAVAAQTRGDMESLRYDLSALWGSADPVFEAPVQPMTAPADPGPANLGQHPAIKVAEAGIVARQAEQDLARAQGIPDLTLSAGMRQFEQTGDTAFLLGVSVPVPLFDRNRDATRAAGYRTDAGRADRVAVEARLLASQRASVAQVRAAQERLALLENDALPSARSAYEASVQGYAAGKFDLTSTLDARKGLIDAGVAVIDAARALNTENMRLRSLIGAAPFNGDIQ